MLFSVVFSLPLYFRFIYYFICLYKCEISNVSTQVLVCSFSTFSLQLFYFSSLWINSSISYSTSCRRENFYSVVYLAVQFVLSLKRAFVYSAHSLKWSLFGVSLWVCTDFCFYFFFCSLFFLFFLDFFYYIFLVYFVAKWTQLRYDSNQKQLHFLSALVVFLFPRFIFSFSVCLLGLCVSEFILLVRRWEYISIYI